MSVMIHTFLFEYRSHFDWRFDLAKDAANFEIHSGQNIFNIFYRLGPQIMNPA